VKAARRIARDRIVTAIAAGACLLFAPAAQAHKPSDSYITLTPRGAEIGVRWDIAVRDLEYAIGVDQNGDGSVTWGELRRAADAIRAYALGHLRVSADGQPCAPGVGTLRVVSHSDGAYATMNFSATCPSPPRSLAIDYSLLFDLDPQHRGIARMADGSGRVLIFDIDRRHLEISLASLARSGQLAAAIRSGVHHIWTGYDHMLFLLALLFPAVLRRERGGWVAVSRFPPALADVTRTVTAFTVAHSITLTLAALGFVSLPSKLIEVSIAASVVLVAANNLFPVLQRDRWTAAFALGLLHGFGFSSTLADVGLSGRALLPTLFGFNAGVEIGQLAIVAAFVPMAFALRNTGIYRRVVFRGGSAVILVVAAIWLVQRAFGVSLLGR
jgi:HupE / UreJ protein